VLKASRSGYYDWLGRPESPAELRNKELAKMIREIHRDSRGSYGSPRVHAELRLGKGMEVNRKRVERLMREAGIQGNLPAQRPEEPGQRRDRGRPGAPRVHRGRAGPPVAD